jgi:hypothetical protein
MALSADLMRRLQIALSVPPQTNTESGGEIAAAELQAEVEGGGGVDGVLITNDITLDWEGDVNTGIFYDTSQAATAFNNSRAVYASTDAPDGTTSTLDLSFQTGSQTFAGTAGTGNFIYTSGPVTNAGNSGASGWYEWYTGDVAGSGASGYFLFTTGSVVGGTRGTFGVHSDVINFHDNDPVFFSSNQFNEFWGSNIYGMFVNGQDAGIAVNEVYHIGLADSALTNPSGQEILISAGSLTGVITTGGNRGFIEIFGTNVTNASSTIAAGNVDISGGFNNGSGNGGRTSVLGGRSFGAGEGGTVELRGGNGTSGINWVGCHISQPVFVNAVGTSNPSTSFYPDGSMYYNTSDNSLRVLGTDDTWRSVSLT